MSAVSTQPANVLRAWLLLLLRGRPAHGYEMSRRLLEHGVKVDNAGIYRTLRELEADSCVSSEWKPSADGGPRKRVYKLTRRGRRRLSGTAKEMAEAKAAFDRFLTVYGESR